MPVKVIRKQINKKKTHSKYAHWSQKQRFNCVVTYLLTGTVPATAAATGIPFDTVKRWKQTTWWKQMEQEIRDSRNLQLNSKLSKVTDLALKNLEDRIEKGDFYYNPKTKQVVRVPVNAKTLNTISKDSIDREVLLSKLIENKPEEKKDEDIRTRLDNLMDEFRKFAKKGNQLKKGEIIDVEPIIEQIGVSERSPERDPEKI